ncbi:hypothetical protein HY031_03115 [Candidatus Gottesmanbacteria bacterium]|nr:hypothetical protein [Candidatus Gottesmanbacteria bacterium]
MSDDIFQDKNLLTELQKLTLERLKAMPKNTEVAIGSDQYSRDDLVRHVTDADELGQQIMEIQLEFLQDLASGEIYKDDSFSYATPS